MDFYKIIKASLALVFLLSFSSAFAGQVEKYPTFATLQTYHSSCDSANPTAIACRAAANRYCRANGFITGYGPVELSGNETVVVCVDSESANSYLATFTQLKAKDAGCTSATLDSANCRNATDKYCSELGFVNGGIGPVEQGSTGAAIFCLKGVGKKRLKVRYTQLAAERAGCSNNAFTSINCITAAHRYCQSKQYLSGVPPYKKETSIATLTCMEVSSPTVSKDSRFDDAHFENVNFAQVPNVIVSHDGCIVSTRYVQLPDGAEDYYLGRDGYAAVPENPCGGGLKLTVSSFNRTAKKFEYMYDILKPPMTIFNGTHRIDSAYDPHVIKYNGEYWVAFECWGVNVVGGESLFGNTAASCVAPLGAFGVLDPNRLSVVVKGGAYNPYDNFRYSASVPKLLNHQNRLYLYWSSVKISAADSEYWESVTERGVELELSGGKFYAKGYRVPVVANSPDTVTVWDVDSVNTGVAQLQDIRSDGRKLYALGSLGAGTVCAKAATFPLPPLCYRLAVAVTRLPLERNTFGENVVNEMRTNDAWGYQQFINYDGKLAIYAHLTNLFAPDKVFPSNFYIFKVGQSTSQPSAVASSCASDQLSPHWGLTRGSCLASCGGIGGTVSHDYMTCNELNLKNYGAAYDVEYCCGPL